MKQFQDVSILRRDIYTDGINYDYNFARLCKLQKKLTFNMDFFNYRFKPGLKSPFKEIRFAKPSEVINPQFDYIIKNHSKQVICKTYFRNLRNAVKMYLHEVLKPSEKYLHFHSGGWDSRIISCAIAELRDEGMKIDIHFLCHEPECETFRSIMKMLNWKPDQYSCFNATGDNPFELGLKNVNGWASFAQGMKFWQQFDESKYNLIHGWGNEAAMYSFKYGNYPKIHCANRLINAVWDVMIGRQWEGSLRMKFKDLILPFFSYYYLDAVQCDPSRIKIDKGDRHRDSMRREFLLHWNYPINKISYSRETINWKLNEKTKKLIMGHYYNSQFYRIYKKNISPFVNWKGLDGQILGFAGTFEKIV